MNVEEQVKKAVVPRPTTPPKGWGVVKRKYVFKDFKFSLNAALVGLLLFAMGRAALHQEVALLGKPVYDMFYFFAAACGFFSLVGAWMAADNPRAEAHTEMREKRKEWLREEVIPYLEQKYDVEFLSYMSLFLQSARVRSNKEHRSFEVRIHGIHPTAREDGEYDLEVEEDIWMEEMIQPKQVSFRALPVVSD